MPCVPLLVVVALGVAAILAIPENPLMTDRDWLDAVSAIGAVLTPILIVVFGIFIASRQSRSEQLQKVRIEYYQQLAPDLNTLMCYMTFIGTWRDFTPVEIVLLKRRLDANFYCALPLFSKEVGGAYNALMDLSFKPFGLWGSDAMIRSNSYRRRTSWRRVDVSWDSSWDEMFELCEEGVSAGALTTYRGAYDEVLARMVEDLNLEKARPDYTTARVSLNASTPPAREVKAE